MLNPKSKLINEAYLFADAFAFLFSMTLANWLIYSEINENQWIDFIAARLSLTNLAIMAALLGVWLGLFQLLGLYRQQSMVKPWNQQFREVANATAVATLSLAVSSVLMDISLISLHVLLIFWLFGLTITFSCRMLIQLLLRHLNVGDNNHRSILIVGTNHVALDYGHKVDLQKAFGYQVLGYLDEKMFVPNDQINLIGTFDDFPRLLDHEIIDEVVIAMPMREYASDLNTIIALARERGVLVRFPLAQMMNHLNIQPLWPIKSENGYSTYDELQLDVVLHSGHQVGWQYFLKRMIDMFGATVILTLTLPLSILAIFMVASSPGPILFVQERYGYNGRVFRLYKFRTMTTDADEQQEQLRAQCNEMDGGAFKMRNDPRITWAGRWLRKTSIDELPQLINVLRGEMSLVGPRPLPLADYRHFQQVAHKRRLSVRPGITCTWQIKGRNEIPFEEWMELDMEYIDNWTLMLDIKILAQTLPAVLSGRGAS